MKHQVVFGIWTARELCGEGGAAIHQLWFSERRSTSARLQHSDFPIHTRPARVLRVATDKGPESAGARRRNGCVWPKADLPRIQRIAHIAPGEFRLRYGVLQGLIRFRILLAFLIVVRVFVCSPRHSPRKCLPFANSLECSSGSGPDLAWVRRIGCSGSCCDNSGPAGPKRSSL